MNIDKEMKEIYLENKDIDAIVEELKEQQKIVEMKLYLMKCISFSNMLENLVPEMKSLGFQHIVLKYEHDYEAGTILSFVLSYGSDSSENISYLSKPNKNISMLSDKMYDFTGVSTHFLSDELYNKEEMVLEIKSGIAEKALKTLLSDFILKTFEISKLDILLPDSKKQNNDKMKI